MENKRLLFDANNEQKSLTNEEESARTRSYLGETARVGALYALTSTIMKKTNLLSSKSRQGRSGIAMAAAIGIGMVTAGENNRLATLGGAMLLTGGASGYKAFASNNGDQIVKGLTSLDNAIGSFNRGTSEFFQKFKESTDTSGIPATDPIQKVIAKAKGGFDFLTSKGAWDGSTSNLFDEWTKNRSKLLSLSKEDKDFDLTGPNAKYFKKMVKRDDVGWSPFSEILRYTKADGTTNLSEVFKKGTDPGNIITYIRSNKEEIQDYVSNELENVQDFNLTSFIENRISKGVGDEFAVDKEFLSYYKSLTSGDSGVKVQDLIDENSANTFDVISNKIFGSDSDLLTTGTVDLLGNVFKDVNVKALTKTKSGKIFDASILDSKAWAIDIASGIENSLRPVFSFLPGSKSNSFSLIPVDLKGIKRGRGKSDFQFITSNEDLKGGISALKKVKESLTKGGTSYEKIMKYSDSIEQADKTIKGTIGDVDKKLNELITKQAKYGDVKNNFLKGVDIEATHDNYHVDMYGQLITDPREKLVGVKNQAGKLSVLTDKTMLGEKEWKTFEGNFKLTYDRVYKENLFKQNNEYLASGFHDYGVSIEEQHYYGDTVFSHAKRIGSEILGKVSFGRLGVNDKITQKEWDQTMSNVKKIKDDFVEDIISKSANEIKITDGEVLEDVIKSKLQSTEATDFLNSIGYSPDYYKKETLNIFNLEQRTKMYYGEDSFNDETIGNAVKRSFISRLLKEGYGQDSPETIEALFAGNKNINRDYFESIFVRQPVATSKGQFSRVTGSGGVRETIANLNFNSTYEEGFGTVTGAYINEFFGKMESTLNFLGIRKMDDVLSKLTGGKYKKFNSQTANPVSSFLEIMKKRVAPILLGVYAAQALEGATDLMNPFADTGVGGLAAMGFAGVRLGFQHIMEKTGLQGAANAIVQAGLGGLIEPLDLHLSTEEMKERYFEGKEVEIKRGRFWFGGNRTSFAGSDTKEFRQHWLYRMQNRDSGIYEDKTERFIRQDFLVTKLLSRITNPYLEEQRLEEKGMLLDKSEKLFTEIPVVGELLAQTIGRLIKPFKYYTDNTEEINPFLSVVDRAFEDLKTWGGYSGYALTSASNYLFGGGGVADLAAEHLGAETRELSSIDAITAAHNQFYALEIGGMFGITEPIRRIFTGGRDRIVNAQAQTGVDWYDKAINDSYSDNVLSALKSKTKQLDGEESELIQRLRVMGNVAPAGTDYYMLESQARSAMRTSGPDEARRLQGLTALGRAVRSKDTTIADKYKNIKVSNSFTLGNNQVLKPGDFYSGGKRYKLAGIETDFTKLSEKLGSSKASKELSRLSEYIQSNSISAVKNEDVLSSVKIDDDGEYFEVFSEDVASQFKSLRVGSALGNAGKSNIFGRAAQGIRNTFSAASSVLNKSVTGRSAYQQFVNETQVNPSFRSWEDPVGSFMNPMFSGSTINMRRSLSQAGSMSNTDGNYFLKAGIIGSHGINKVLGTTTPANYAKSDIIQMKLEAAKFSAGEDSIYNLNQSSSYSQIKKSLTYDEKGLFQSLMNADTTTDRQKIYNAGSSRFRRVMDVVSAKKLQYATGQQVQLKRLASPARSDFRLTGNYFEDIIRAKRESGFMLQGREKMSLINSALDQEYFKNSTPLEARQRRSNRMDSKIMSNIYGGDGNNFVY